MAQIRDLQNKVNSLSDAREHYDPESGSSSGATHVLDQISTILSSRTDIATLRFWMTAKYTELYGGIIGNVLARPFVQEGLLSTIFHNSKNWASQDLILDIAETARREK